MNEKSQPSSYTLYGQVLTVGVLLLGLCFFYAVNNRDGVTLQFIENFNLGMMIGMAAAFASAVVMCAVVRHEKYFFGISAIFLVVGLICGGFAEGYSWNLELTAGYKHFLAGAFFTLTFLLWWLFPIGSKSRKSTLNNGGLSL
ncbi:hypothetical protein [Collimonas arenae]|uniref:hypothetical protein n=1 Tax=Collimonas arenae TaxID=279058 RepID=UPI000589CD1A|nr:hypothetical protein [Collimonas arenae]